jgi:hypothetical protein
VLISNLIYLKIMFFTFSCPMRTRHATPSNNL